MASSEELMARIDNLEARIAHQDQAIDDLNATATLLWSRIDELTRALSKLRDQVELAEAGAGPLEAEPRPPHY